MTIGSPFEEGVLCGPLQNANALKIYENAIENATKNGGIVRFGAQRVTNLPGNYVFPTIIEVDRSNPACHQESFVPITYAIKASSLEDAIVVNNSASQGLSSSIFTQSLGNIFTWTGYRDNTGISTNPCDFIVQVDQIAVL